MNVRKNLLTRRSMMVSGAAAIAGGAALLGEIQRASADAVATASRAREGTAAATGGASVDQTALAPGEPGPDYTPVVTPNGVSLPFKIVNGVKVFHLIAEEV